LIGDVIAADGILTSSSDLRVDESSHTGESDDVYKSTDTDPVLYCGQYSVIPITEYPIIEKMRGPQLF